ncbi:uncharacterized protein LOC126375095 [Pectinophora gossypiella]|uniref:uncharacterized protein LOC126375095 n=1 Tax=Pectinophora gossypiella TaxID=13191 RepID=UPI00214EDB54|nr:uncharacterized protein LOC126375095 [Pectinophora gossypiella]
MDLCEALTITKLYVDDERSYLLIEWKLNAFEMYLYTSDGKLWKGRFSKNRMYGFSKNLHLSGEEYFDKVRRCLSQYNEDYVYEMKSGFFYWKRRMNDSLILEGFLPVETTPTEKHPNLVEVLLAINKNLKDKVKDYHSKYHTIKTDFQQCLKDTEEFLNLKIEMEKSLCEKFLNLVNTKKNKLENVNDKLNSKLKGEKSIKSEKSPTRGEVILQ